MTASPKHRPHSAPQQLTVDQSPLAWDLRPSHEPETDARARYPVTTRSMR